MLERMNFFFIKENSFYSQFLYWSMIPSYWIVETTDQPNIINILTAPGFLLSLVASLRCFGPRAGVETNFCKVQKYSTYWYRLNCILQRAHLQMDQPSVTVYWVTNCQCQCNKVSNVKCAIRSNAKFSIARRLSKAVLLMVTVPADFLEINFFLTCIGRFQNSSHYGFVSCRSGKTQNWQQVEIEGLTFDS